MPTAAKKMLKKITELDGDAVVKTFTISLSV